MRIINSLPVYLLIAACLLLTTPRVSAQDDEEDEEDAIDKGTATVLVVGETQSQFAEKRNNFTETVAYYASKHCKKSSGNCDTEDKHIRANDVIILSETEVEDGMEVALYIRDRAEDPVDPALTDSQLADVFWDYDSDISQTYGTDVEVLDPEKSWWEWWRILLLTLFCLIALILILLGIYLCYDAWRKSKRKDEEEKKSDISRQISAYDSVTIEETGYQHLQEQSSIPGDQKATAAYTSIVIDGTEAAPTQTQVAAAPPVYDNAGDQKNQQEAVITSVQKPDQENHYDQVQESTTYDNKAFTAEDEKVPEVTVNTSYEDDEDDHVTAF